MNSVIIPVYNTGEYLVKCITSIQNQSFKDLQIIIIDDGSSEETALLCDSLALSDSRIEVIHKKNEGVSIARNVGLDHAKGEYIFFVDSDDTLHPQMIELLTTGLESDQSDMIICDALTIKSENKQELDTINELTSSLILSKQDLTPEILKLLAGSVWRCAYKKSLIQKNKNRFPENLKFSEDRLFNLQAIGSSSKISYIKKPLYNRLIREGSACYSIYPDITEQIVLWRKNLFSILQQYWNKSYYEVYEKQIASHILFAITNITSPKNNLKSPSQIKLIKDLCDNEEIQECLKNSNIQEIRSKLISNHNIFALFLLGKIINYKQLICRPR